MTEKIISVLKKIPGFRKGNPVGMILACFMYVLFYVMLTINDGITGGDKTIITVQKCFIFLVPYVLFFNVFGIQQKLPFFKKKIVGFVVSFCISILCAVASLNLTPKMMSPAYKKAVEMRQEMYQKEKEERLRQNNLE